MSNQILIVGSNTNLLEIGLGKERFQTITISPDDVIAQIEKVDPSFVILDLPVGEGTSLSKLIKEKVEWLPIVVISPTKREDEKRACLRFANIFIEKFLQLETQITLIKAFSRLLNQVKIPLLLKGKDLEIDLQSQLVKRAGKLLHFSFIHYRLLVLFVLNKGRVITRKEIMEKIWGKGVIYRTVDVHIKRLREKLGEEKYPSQYIETIHGRGYRFIS